MVKNKDCSIILNIFDVIKDSSAIPWSKNLIVTSLNETLKVAIMITIRL